MKSRSLTNRYFVKVISMGFLGCALVVGWSDLGFAIPKLRPGKSYCSCSCKTFSKGVGLDWEKVASCSLNGKKCKGKNSAGVSEDGILEHCNECKADSTGSGYSDCTPVRGLTIPQSGGTTPPVLPGTLDAGPRKPSVAPFSKQGMNAPIMRRGVEGEPSTPSPTVPEEQGK